MSAHVVEMRNINALVSWSVERGLLERMGMASPDELGQVLHDENVRSVNYRYQEDTAPDRYDHKPEDANDIPKDSIEAFISSLSYQCCETTDWKQTKANECLAFIECDMLQSGHRAVSSLHSARHPMVVEALIKRGYDPNAVRSMRDDHYQNRPLHCAGSPDIAKALIAGGADVEGRNANGFTPLHDAAASNDREMVELLVRNGANIEARAAKESMTPLHLAAGNGFTECGIALLDAGADPMAQIANGATCIDYAEAASDGELVKNMHAVLAERQAKQLDAMTVAANGVWSPSVADSDRLAPCSIQNNERHSSQAAQRVRRI